MKTIKPDKCPMSGHPMADRQRKDGSGTFLACTGFPECKYIWKDPTEVKPAYRKTPTVSYGGNNEVMNALREIYKLLERTNKKIDDLTTDTVNSARQIPDDYDVTKEDIADIFPTE